MNDDVGMPRTVGGTTRPTLTDERLDRDLTAIAEELHATGVRIAGADVGRIERAADRALARGLAAWLSPTLHDLPRADLRRRRDRPLPRAGGPDRYGSALRRRRDAAARDEQEQARAVVDQLDACEHAGVDEAYVFTFAAPALPHRHDDTLHDLDTSSYALVATRPGDPDGGWDPKPTFGAVAGWLSAAAARMSGC